MGSYASTQITKLRVQNTTLASTGPRMCKVEAGGSEDEDHLGLHTHPEPPETLFQPKIGDGVSGSCRGRPDQVSVQDSYYYDDGCEPCGNDTLSREPAIVKFFSPFTEVREFAIVPLHAAPTDAVTEIDALYDVYLDVRQKWNLEDVMLMGDFNAGCSYVSSSEWSSIRLRTSPVFQWLIPDSADTTVTSTHCAYDRLKPSVTITQWR